MKAICEDENAASRLGDQKGGGISTGADGEQPHAIRNGLICAFVVAACLWAAYPVAEIGINDDWSYVQVARAFAQTGHFVYNGWESAMLGWQVICGALFIKLFGFSFTVVRLSMLPIAMATVFLFHAILLRFGVNARNAALGALTLGLSPLFMPVATTYMTDVPGLFVILLCLYLCQLAADAGNSGRATIAWLCLAAATNVVGGTVRQVAWLGALVMVPSAGWLLRKRRGVVLATFVIWGLSVAGVFACMRWFARQAYSVAEPILKGLAFNHASLVFQGFHLFFQLLAAVLCLSLMVYPILAAWLPEARRLSGAALLRIVLIALLWGLFERTTGWTLPWIMHVIWTEFAFPRIDPLLAPTRFLPMLLPTWTREAISLLVVTSGLILVEYLCNRPNSLYKNNVTHAAPWQDTLWLLGPFTVCYFTLLLPRAFHMFIFDRYLLPMMAIAIIYLLMMYQQWIASTLPPISVVLLTIFALSAIAGTHDWFAWSRARVAAINEIRASGVPRTEIQGGYEYDGWTQVEVSGHMNGTQYVDDTLRMKTPAEDKHSDSHSELSGDCKFKFGSYTPDIHPRLTIIFPKMWCLEPSKYPPVSYSTWLPPYDGKIYVQRIPDASN